MAGQEDDDAAHRRTRTSNAPEPGRCRFLRGGQPQRGPIHPGPLRDCHCLLRLAGRGCFASGRSRACHEQMVAGITNIDSSGRSPFRPPLAPQFSASPRRQFHSTTLSAAVRQDHCRRHSLRRTRSTAPSISAAFNCSKTGRHRDPVASRWPARYSNVSPRTPPPRPPER